MLGQIGVVQDRVHSVTGAPSFSVRVWWKQPAPHGPVLMGTPQAIPTGRRRRRCRQGCGWHRLGHGKGSRCRDGTVCPADLWLCWPGQGQACGGEGPGERGEGAQEDVVAGRLEREDRGLPTPHVSRRLSHRIQYLLLFSLSFSLSLLPVSPALPFPLPSLLSLS